MGGACPSAQGPGPPCVLLAEAWAAEAWGRALTPPLPPQPPDAERQQFGTFHAQVWPAVLPGAHPRLGPLLGEHAVQQGWPGRCGRAGQGGPATQVTSLRWQAPSPAYSSSSLYSPDAVASSGPIISDITELAPSSPLASPGGSVDERWGPRHPTVRRRGGPQRRLLRCVLPVCAGPSPAAPWYASRRSPPALLGALGWRRPVLDTRPLSWRYPCPQPPSLTPSCGKASLPPPPRPHPSRMQGAATPHPRPHLPRPLRSASA